MGEEVRMSEYGGGIDGGDGDGDDRVSEWEAGLPSADDLAPLSQPLISLELASAFSIAPEPSRTLLDVNRASESTLAGLRGHRTLSQGFSSNNEFKSFVEDRDPAAAEEEEAEADGSDSRKMRKIDSAEEADSAMRTDNSVEDPSAKAMKRPRLVWTPQLHKRFVEVVAHLGIKNAVPKTIMQLMNVEGLTRENVASHLQKYRLYLKRMQGLSSEGPSSSDPLFASTPVPQSLHESPGGGGGHGKGHAPMSMPMPYGVPPHMPMPVYGHMGMQMGNPQGFQSNHYMVPQMDWSAGNRCGSLVSYPNSGPNDK
ncbi:hypothetical protein BT93_J1404 [Corymbia citriodora subsp. variegata]|nr:hypothetical protein BT93_J1404 [Corymbia citriodora subsp. variegata]